MVVAWIAFALAMAVVEVASVAFYAAFLAVGGLAAAVAALLGADVLVQAVDVNRLTSDADVDASTGMPRFSGFAVELCPDELAGLLPAG